MRIMSKQIPPPAPTAIATMILVERAPTYTTSKENSWVGAGVARAGEMCSPHPEHLHCGGLRLVMLSVRARVSVRLSVRLSVRARVSVRLRLVRLGVRARAGTGLKS